MRRPRVVIIGAPPGSFRRAFGVGIRSTATGAPGGSMMAAPISQSHASDPVVPNASRRPEIDAAPRQHGHSLQP